MKESYFIPRCGGKRNPGGKIYNKIFNLKQKRAVRERSEEERQSKKLKPGSVTALDAVGEEAIAWLQLNVEPWTTTLEKWTISFNKRKSNLQKSLSVDTLLKVFRHYKHGYGYQLIDIDFRMLFSTHNEGLSRMDASLTGLIERVSLDFKDEYSSNLVTLLEKVDTSKDSQVCAVLILLNNILPPIKIAKEFKPTTTVGQEDIILFVSPEEDIRSKVNEVYSTHAEWGLAPTVRLVFVGSGAASLSGEFFIVYKDLIYKVDSATRAVDVMVKTTLVFGLEFSRVTRLVWNFICTYFYEIPGLAKYASVLKLIDRLSENQ